ncbi:MAG: hypothetical protein EP326_02615 [Deltaproteobacteria bacterium]|nr:MAG: hypothetical protein EP326_02615 [Deltaproteobacteria bacterium]
MTKKQRYQKLTRYQGIRKDTQTGKYQAYKKVDGRQYQKDFSSLRQAIKWRSEFNPYLDELINEPKGEKFSVLLEKYKELHLAGLKYSTQEVFNERSVFFDEMLNVCISDITPVFIDSYLKRKKELAIQLGSTRSDFREELKKLKAIFNWYRENYDHTFINPVLKRHHILGKIKDRQKKEKKMTEEEVVLFFESLDEGIWKEFAILQFYLSARVGEVAGLLSDCVDLKNRQITIKRTAFWSRQNKQFVGLTDTKTGESKPCHLNDTMFKIVVDRMNSRPPGCEFLFHENGEPLKYRTIQYRYNKALKKCGLSSKYSSTHILRHSMATVTRKVTGSLESTQAVTGHKDQRLVEHYSVVPSLRQIEAVNQVEKHLNDLMNFKSAEQS